MLKVILLEVAKPLIRRIGSIASGALVATSMTSDQINQIETYAVALALLLVDLVLSKLDRETK
jgi:Na+/glutamate symporter